MKEDILHRVIWDKYRDNESTSIQIKINNQGIEICPVGYGDATSEDGHGCPVFLEIWDGELRVVIWGDIKKEDPTHIISLEGAREDMRKNELVCNECKSIKATPCLDCAHTHECAYDHKLNCNELREWIKSLSENKG